MKKKICIIPARGGSKRILNKNIKDFCGKPIIAYSIEAAIKSNLFDEVMVSTDSVEIAKVAKEYGAEVPFFRSDKNSNDFATTFDVIEEVLAYYNKEGKDFAYACCIYACAPFVTKQRLEEAFDLLIKDDFDTVFPIMEYGHPIQRALKVTAKKVSMFDDKFITTRTQDLEKSYFDAGQFYWMQTKKVLQSKKIFSNNSGCLVLSEMEGQDIDNLVDWKLAELKYKIFIE